MTTIESALLVVLGVAFLVLLLMSITVAFFMIKILQSIRKITQKAESATDNISETIKSVSKKLAPLAASSLSGLILKKLTNRRKK